MSLFSHERKLILDRYLCVIVPIHHSSASAVTQWCRSSVSRSLRSVTVPPGSDSLGKVSSACAPASYDTVVGRGLFRSLGWDQLLSWFILRPKRLQGQCHRVFFCVYQIELLSRGYQLCHRPPNSYKMEINIGGYWDILDMTSWPRNGRLSIESIYSSKIMPQEGIGLFFTMSVY